MQLAWPWSVPRLPFSCAVRPNSDMVTSATSAMRSPMSRQKALSACPYSRSRLASCPSEARWPSSLTWWSQPPISANAISMPTSDLISCAICRRLSPNRAARILGPGRRRVRLLLHRLQHRDGLEGLLAGRAQHGILRLHVHLLELTRRLGVAHLEAGDILQRHRRIGSRHGARQRRPPATRRAPATPAWPCRGLGSARFIQPIVGGLQTGRARFHVVLRVEVRARRIGRPHRVHNRQVLLVEQRLQRRQRRVQAEEAIQVDGGIFAIAAAKAAARRWSAADRSRPFRRAAPPR